MQYLLEDDDMLLHVKVTLASLYFSMPIELIYAVMEDILNEKDCPTCAPQKPVCTTCSIK